MGVVTLVSGGFDSTLMSLMAFEEGMTLFPLFVDYGQLGAEREWDTCQRLHRQFGLPSVTRMDLAGFGQTVPSGLTDSSMRVNEDAFLPGRNLLLILAGSAHAWTVRVDSVALGLLNPRDQLFPDQSKEFVQDCERAVAAALGKRIRILTPLMEFCKSDILVMARDRGLESAYSCHLGKEDPCGVCIACQELDTAREGR